MLNQQGLCALLNLEPDEHRPVVDIYTTVKSVRFDFTCQFIFKHVIGARFRINNSKEEFEKSSHFKINYSDAKSASGLWIKPAGLLGEKGLDKIKPPRSMDGEQLHLYKNEGDLGFDIFSAVFFMVSRYEEWQDYEKDEHGRFEAAQSILFTQNFHLRPVTDQWIAELRSALQKQTSAHSFPAKEFKLISSLDIDNLYAFKGKGLLRSFGATCRDLLKGDLKQIKLRQRVLAGEQKDPFDVYEEVADLCFERHIPLFCFFLMRSGTRYDRSMHPSSPAFGEVISSLKKNQAVVGLHPSYHAHQNENLLKEEIAQLNNAKSSQVVFSRQHYLRFDIRKTPALLLSNGITTDFTMGYASAPGFRAGTAYPFYHYDFATEQAGELLHVPFCAMDGAYSVYGSADPEKALQSMLQLAAEVKKTGGFFVTVFHERSFYNHLYKGFGSLYKKLHMELSR